MTRVRLSYSLLNPVPALASDGLLDVFSLFLSGMSKEEANLYQLDWQESQVEEDKRNWTRWKSSLEAIGARNC